MKSEERMLVVKDNALINASYNLDLVEQRLILLAIVEARESGRGINSNDPLSVHAESYVNQFGVHRNTAYEALKVACDNLFARQFSYQEINARGNAENVKSRWVSEIRYIDSEATVKLIFAPVIVPLITRLEEHFTSYELEQVAKLQSRYSTRLYEMLSAWRSTGKSPVFELELFRRQLGVGLEDYKAMSDFKRNVLEKAIQQINDSTDITVSYDQHKKGRTITGFSFKFKPKQKPQKTEQERDQNTADLFTKMSDAQRHMFAHKLARDERIESEYSHLVGSGTYEQFATKLAEMMANEAHFSTFLPILKEYGFKA